MDPSEPRWLTNSSFSPPPLRRQDYQFQSDRLPHGYHRVAIYGSSLSSHGKKSRSRLINDQYPNHQHSVSDGALSYYGSPSDNFQPSQWTPPARRFDFGDLSTSMRGSRPEISLFPESSEMCFTAGMSSISNSIDSASPPSESGQWASTNKPPALFSHNVPGRRSFMSKPVYPLVFRNPISDGDAFMAAETSGGSMSTAIENKNSPMWSEHAMNSELKFHKTLGVVQKADASPDPSSSLRRREFRCSSASYNFGLEGDGIDALEHISPLNLRSPNNSAGDQKCGLCGRLLWQRSPWSSLRIIRNADMPIAGVLPCRHVFHAECLEETTPKTKINEPPCPLCLKAVSPEGSVPFSEPLQVALRSARRREIATREAAQTSGDLFAYNSNGNVRRGRSLSILQQRRPSLIKNHFKKHFSLEGKMGKSSFGSKMFAKITSTSSLRLRTRKKQPGHTH